MSRLHSFSSPDPASYHTLWQLRVMPQAACFESPPITSLTSPHLLAFLHPSVPIHPHKMIFQASYKAFPPTWILRLPSSLVLLHNIHQHKTMARAPFKSLPPRASISSTCPVPPVLHHHIPTQGHKAIARYCLGPLPSDSPPPLVSHSLFQQGIPAPQHKIMSQGRLESLPRTCVSSAIPFSPVLHPNMPMRQDKPMPWVCLGPLPRDAVSSAIPPVPGLRHDLPMRQHKPTTGCAFEPFPRTSPFPLLS